jgi:acyl-coenzyme A synthetase/AMP-(fatty) acid ligase
MRGVGGGAGLPFLRADALQVARQGGRVVSRAAFLAEIEELASLLPDQPYVVNFCADRYRFAVGWAAAMLRRQITLLPASRDAAAVAALGADYPALYVLADDDDACAMAPAGFAYPALKGAAGGSRAPAFPPDQIAAVLFTSGSTGRPQASPRRWGRLVAGSLAAGKALGIHRHAGAALIATVPHGHSYGLESAVVLPLQHGLLLTADRPFFPADVTAALSGDGPPGVLVTTPVHLRALTQEAAMHAERPSPVRVGFVLSATAPLSMERAAAAEAAFGAPVFEIYGCSEAGQLATRRTTDGPVWRCLDGFRLWHDAAGCWASGPHEDDVLLADQIEQEGDSGFILRGRTADLVNVAGKRSSLAYLTHELTSVPGVEDGVFLQPESEAADAAEAGSTPRLIAVAVAPGLDAPTIIARLRARIDAAFLPRPLYLVSFLPRNMLGKLPRSEILGLIGSGPARAGEAAAPAPEPMLLSFPDDLPAARGHFPGDPIVPGAVLLDRVLPMIFPDGWSGEIEAAKFHSPVRPGDTVSLSYRTQGNATRFECRLTGSAKLVLSGALRSPFPSR